MKKNNIIDLITSITSIFLIVMSISLIYSLYKLNTIKFIYILIFSFILLIVDIILINIIDKKKGNKIIRSIFTILSLIVIVILFMSISYIITTFKFIESATKVSNEYQEYSVIIKNDKNVRIQDLNDRLFGFLSLNENINDSKMSLSENANISILTKDFDDNKSLKNALNSNEVDAAVILTDVFKESKDYNSFKEIYKFKVNLNQIYNNKADFSKPFSILFTGNTSFDDLNRCSNNNINILGVFNPKTKKIVLVYIPKDLDNKNKLSSANGIDNTLNSVNNLFDIKVNYYVKTNKKFISNLTNKLSIDFKCDDTCLETIESQKELTKNIVDQIKELDTLIKYNDILYSTKDYIKTNITYDEAFNLIRNNNLLDYDIEYYLLDDKNQEKVKNNLKK